MFTFKTIAELSAATLLEGDVVKVLGEINEGDSLVKEGVVHLGDYVTQNRTVTIANGLKCVLNPVGAQSGIDASYVLERAPEKWEPTATTGKNSVKNQRYLYQPKNPDGSFSGPAIEVYDPAGDNVMETKPDYSVFYSNSITPSFSSLQDALLILQNRSEIEGEVIHWRGYWSQSDGGSGWGVVRSGDVAGDGGSQIRINNLFYIEQNLTENTRVSIRKFGVRDGQEYESHTTQQLENWMKYLSGGWGWKGSISATNNFRNIKGGGYLPTCDLYISRSLRIHPSVDIKGAKPCSFSDNGSSVSKITANFDRSSGYKYVIDCAPYNEEGEIVWGLMADKLDFDNGTKTHFVGTVVRNIHTDVLNPSVNKLDGGFNFAICIEGEFTGNKSRNAAVGAQLSCSWSGSLSKNNFNGKCYGLVIATDVTTFKVGNNYLGTQSKSWGDEDYQGITTPLSNYDKKTSCIATLYSNPRCYYNTLEGAEYAVISNINNGGNFENNYIEGDFTCAYVTGSSSLNIKCGTTSGVKKLLENAIGANSSPITIDITGIGTSLLGAGESPITSNGSKIKVISGGKVLGSVKIPDIVSYQDVSVNNSQIAEIYVNSAGDDNNHGYNSQNKVKTLVEAFKRCRKDKNNFIYLDSGDTVAMSEELYSVFDDINVNIVCKSGTASVSVDSTEVRLNHIVVNGSVSLNKINILMTESQNSVDYNSIFSTKSDLNISFTDCDIVGKPGKALCGAIFGCGGKVDINFLRGSVSNCNLIGSSSDGSSVIWTEMNRGTSFSNVLAGDSSFKVMSKQF